VKEKLINAIFQLSQVMAQRRLRQMQYFCRVGQVPGLCYRRHQLKVSDIKL
jgi:hypothetical protein